MAYILTTLNILENLGYSEFIDFEINNGVLDWYHIDLKPTEAEIIALEIDWIKDSAKELLNIQGIKEVEKVYTFVNDPSFITFMKDMYAHINTDGSRLALSGNLLAIKNVEDVLVAKKAEVNLLNTVAEVEAYIATSIATGWP